MYERSDHNHVRVIGYVRVEICEWSGHNYVRVG